MESEEMQFFRKCANCKREIGYTYEEFFEEVQESDFCPYTAGAFCGHECATEFMEKVRSSLLEPQKEEVLEVSADLYTELMRSNLNYGEALQAVIKLRESLEDDPKHFEACQQINPWRESFRLKLKMLMELVT